MVTASAPSAFIASHDSQDAGPFTLARWNPTMRRVPGSMTKSETLPTVVAVARSSTGRLGEIGQVHDVPRRRSRYRSMASPNPAKSVAMYSTAEAGTINASPETAPVSGRGR